MSSFQARTSSLGTVTQPTTCSPLERRYCMSFCVLVLESSASGSKPVPPSHLCNTLWNVWVLFLACRSFKPHFYFLWKFVIVTELLSHVWLFVTPWAAACQASLSFTISRSLLRLVSIESVMPSHHLILCRPLLPCLQSFPASESFPMSRLFPSGGPNYWSFSTGAENLWHGWIWLGNLGFLEESLYGDFRVF